MMHGNKIEILNVSTDYIFVRLLDNKCFNRRRCTVQSYLTKLMVTFRTFANPRIKCNVALRLSLEHILGSNPARSRCKYAVDAVKPSGMTAIQI